MVDIGERTIRLANQSVGTASARLVELCERTGYQMAATAPRTFQLIRSKRGLFGKRDEVMMLMFFEDRHGAGVRATGTIDDELLAYLSGVGPGSPPAKTPQPTTPAIASPAVESHRGRQVAPEVPSIEPSRSNRPGVAPSGLISSVPGAPPSGPVSDRPTANEQPRPEPPVAGDLSRPAGAQAHVDVRPDVSTASATHRTPAPMPSFDTVARTKGRPESPHAVVVFPDGRRQSLDVMIVIGRDPSAEAEAWAVPVTDPGLSKTHCSVRRDGTDLVVRDLHSTNGTEVEVGGVWRALAPDEDFRIPIGDLTISAAGVMLKVEVAA